MKDKTNQLQMYFKRDPIINAKIGYGILGSVLLYACALF